MDQGRYSTNPTSMTDLSATLHQHNQQQRCYFYNIDLHGRLYLEETMPKNIVTSIKDIRFLDFFFSRIKYINELHREFMILQDIPVNDYPFISICGNEWNFIRPAATPIVFHSIVDQYKFLLYGSADKSILRESFNETDGIALSKQSGKLYHRLTTHSYYPLSKKIPRSKKQQQYQIEQEQYALLRTSVAIELSDRIVLLSDESHERNDDEDQHEIYSYNPKQQQQPMSFPIESSDIVPTATNSHLSSSGMGFVTSYGRIAPISYLPQSAEPGPWAMPHNNNME
jgi:hypothetical protein